MAEANLIKFHRKSAKVKKVCHAQKFGSSDQGQDHIQVSQVKICFANYSKDTSINVIKLLLKL